MFYRIFLVVVVFQNYIQHISYFGHEPYISNYPEMSHVMHGIT